jgi:hypothetical protein
MNYFGPRKRQSDDRWDYTNRNANWIYPIGYCSNYTPLDSGLIKVSEQQAKDHTRFKDKYHTTGHATADEACECYKEYLLDRRFHVKEYSDTKHKCQVCGEWTQGYVQVGSYQTFDLCDKHANREEVSKLFEVWTSVES